MLTTKLRKSHIRNSQTGSYLRSRLSKNHRSHLIRCRPNYPTI